MDPGWDRFLTERDQAHLAASGWDKRRPFGLGSRPAVLVVDDYREVLGIEREPLLEAVRTWPMSCGLEGWDAIDRTVPLLAAARAAAVPVVYVRGLDGFPSPWGWRHPEPRLPPLAPERKAVANDIVAEVAPQPGDLVLDKAAPSAFAGTPLAFHLTYLGIDTLVVVGETTSGCVRASVVDAVTARYRVAVVAECCFDRTEAAHWINLFDMHQKYADVIDLDEAIGYLSSVAAAASAAPKDGAVAAD